MKKYESPWMSISIVTSVVISTSGISIDDGGSTDIQLSRKKGDSWDESDDDD